jgi:hypothetical protein
MRWEKSYSEKVEFLFPTEKITVKMFLQTESYARVSDKQKQISKETEHTE